MAATDFVTESQLDSLTTTSATAVKSNATDIAANLAAHTAHTGAASSAHAASAISIVDTGTLFTATDVEGALAEVKTVADSAAGGGAVLNDSITDYVVGWTGQKIADEAVITADARINAIFGGAGNIAALLAEIDETDLELIARIGDAVSFTVAQTRSAGEKTQALTNLGMAPSTVDFAANFTAGLA